MTTTNPEPTILNPLAYDTYRPLALTGDLLLCRPSSEEGKLICEVKRDSHSHVAMAGWASPDALMLAETRQRCDARLISLRGEVKRWSGFYDVYRVRRSDPLTLRVCSYRPDAAWAFMCHAAGSNYGWSHLWRAGLRRKFSNYFNPIPNSNDPQFPRDCSALIHAAMRASGGPILAYFDCDVTPGDFSRASEWEYHGTLYATEQEAAAVRLAVLGKYGATRRPEEAGGQAA